eukprot:CAMPEP_0115519282 /NCGR_PEP_ID=MMETSP0271-20121206/78351_1 /TAXON_ID=71861 /ORGANISM="Scrippsiella trochoidea, Strain CCMP3099" /LENGTH=125 /DNA_ID=CAMNT_0002950279 /DNA_START=29 /DNA_END=402 /DNA_ORIENTATION=-
MPLVVVFAKAEDLPKFSASDLEQFLIKLFGVDPGIVQVLMLPVYDLSPDAFYVSIRAKGNPERRERMPAMLSELSAWLATRGAARWEDPRRALRALAAVREVLGGRRGAAEGQALSAPGERRAPG